MKKCILTITLLIMVLCSSACDREHVDTLTYAVFPYIPDSEYYQEIIEARWAELEPDIKLVRANWDGYYDGMPEGIDVVMYDAVMLDKLISEGWIQPIDPNAVQEAEDIYPYAMDGITVQDKLYGIPVFLCGNYLIYDRDSELLAAAEHITDLKDESQILVINSEHDFNRHQYLYEISADIRGEANPSIDSNAEEYLSLIDRLADKAHKKDVSDQVAMAFDSGIGQGYIGYSESMRLLRSRFDKTGIKSISFSDGENIPRIYVDAAAVTAGVKGKRYEKCLELINVMAEADVMTDLSVEDGKPQYLMPARKSPYKPLAEQFPMYSELEKLTNNEKNHVIRTPWSVWHIINIADTHPDNMVMQNLLTKLGFEKRGIIHVIEDDDPRYAYEKIRNNEIHNSWESGLPYGYPWVEKINSLGCEEMWDDASPLWFRPQYYYEEMYMSDENLQVDTRTWEYTGTKWVYTKIYESMQG